MIAYKPKLLHLLKCIFTVVLLNNAVIVMESIGSTHMNPYVYNYIVIYKN